MARFAPAACSPCAIAHAIERLLATPKTTAVRPFKSSNMYGRISASVETRLAASCTPTPRDAASRVSTDCFGNHQSGCPTLTSCFSTLGWARGILIRRRSHHLPRFHRPAGAAKRDRINRSDRAKSRRQADPRCDPAHRQPQCHLQKRAKEIKSILDTSHKLRGHLLHQTGIHGHTADAPRRSHQPIKQYGYRQPRRKWRKRHGE